MHFMNFKVEEKSVSMIHSLGMSHVTLPSVELRKNSPGSHHSLVQISGTPVLAHLFTHVFIQQTFTLMCSVLGPMQDAGW